MRITTRCIAITSTLMLVGCIQIGSQAVPRVSSVRLGNSRYTVTLYGPTSKGNYTYGISANNYSERYGSYSLGLSKVDDSSAPTIKELSSGVFRITWGKGQNAAYAIIDVERGLIIEDSNSANERHFPFVSEPDLAPVVGK